MDSNFGAGCDAISGRTWPVWGRRLASVAIFWHLAALASSEMAALPSSPLERGVAGLFGNYTSLIDQGSSHRYYAPEPPPTPVVTARLHFGDGRADRVVRLPDRSAFPRLRYQRQLALAYHLTADYRGFKMSHGEVGADEQEHEHDEGEGPRLAWSYARHLCKANPGCLTVTLFTQEHRIPRLDRLREAATRPGAARLDLDADEFYTVPERIGEFSCDGF